MKRKDGRSNLDLRPLSITRKFIPHAEGSALIEMGNTKVLITATVDEKVPGWLKGSGSGWITAEYGMLPRSTLQRTPRESVRGHVQGRSMEIQRLIGRSLRSVVNLKALGERQIIIDCDCIQADGGTRTASITGAFVAMIDAMNMLRDQGIITERLVSDYLAAISMGIIDGAECLDLTYEEDSSAQADMNFVMTGAGNIVEIQGTAEREPFSRALLERLLDLGATGIRKIIAYQKEILADVKGLIRPAERK